VGRGFPEGEEDLVRKAVSGFALATLVLGGAAASRAEMALQKKAKEAGFPATGCLYCHNEKIPKKSAVTHNERGQFLVDLKAKNKAKEIDVAWLKDYKGK
jgi:hypothetical protein